MSNPNNRISLEELDKISTMYCTDNSPSCRACDGCGCDGYCEKHSVEYEFTLEKRKRNGK